MNPYLRASLICFAIAIAIGAVMVIEACQHYAVYGVCRHEATLAVVTMGEQYAVRVAVGNWEGNLHSKAQAFIDNKWQWLCVDYPSVRACNGDVGFAPHEYYNGQAWMFKMAANVKVQ